MTKPGLRERKKAKTRQAIEHAAMTLFGQNGFDQTTIDEIVEMAEVSQRTFFRYFATKEDVVLADYHDQLNDLIDHLTTRPPDEEPWDSLRAVFQAVTSDLVRQQEMLPKAAIIVGSPTVYARSLGIQSEWEEQLGETLLARSVTRTTPIEAALMAAAALGIMRVVIKTWAEDPEIVDLTNLVKSCFDRFSSGFQSTQGHIKSSSL